jgi:hypothetical protein
MRSPNQFANAGFKFASNQFIRLQSSDIDLIKNYLVDMVVFASFTAPTDRCQIFEDLHEELVKPVQVKYILRDINLYKRDRTLNRCSWLPVTFCPENYRLGAATPGNLNDCSGRKFNLEDSFPHIIDPETLAANELSYEARSLEHEGEEVNQCNPHRHTSFEFESIYQLEGDE